MTQDIFTHLGDFMVQPLEPSSPSKLANTPAEQAEKTIQQLGEGLRTILVKRVDGSEFKLVLNKEDKLTFGPAIPGPRNGFSGNMEYALRVYRGNKETGLRACFPGVREFRDADVVQLDW